ncbi:membrane cofactor protein-like [Nannospalax galili]|uniref:membrane cofactor protein-like n=1 Tax=Nannospalax galili TaxID=1026970 RepID=UPI0004ED2953|nr:membrane cofactor protein-like [Nannospalax galili]
MVPLQHPQSHIAPGCFLGTFLVVLLSTCSDACGKPPTFESMQIVGIPKITYGAGERVEYACKPGYTRRTSNISTVYEANGQRSAISKNACSKKSCQQQNDPLNGKIHLINESIQLGTQIKFVCNKGFYLIGSKILRCIVKGSNVQWNDQPPQCEKILCAPPPKINNGTFSPSHKDIFGYNDVATYKCDETSGGDEFSLVGNSQIHCSGKDVWSSDPPECKVVKCPYPVIKNGKLTSGFSKKYYYSAKVMFKCNQELFLTEVT